MSEIVCAVCEKREQECACTRYCIICMGQHEIRLCSDGSYYCQDCRDACEVSLANRIESH